MNLLPDFIETQPDEGLVADVRKLAELSLHTLGHQLSPNMLEILSSILVAGTLNARSSEIERAATLSPLPKPAPPWAAAFYLGLRLLAVTQHEQQKKRAAGSRKVWHISARQSLDTALEGYASTTP